MFQRILIRRIILLLAITFAFSVNAEVYKWQDEQGNTHYGDRPDNGQAATEMDVKDATVKTEVGGERAETRDKLLQSMEEDRLEKKELREKQRKQAKRDRARCNSLRDKLRRMSSASGVYRLDKDGNRVFMSNEQRSKSEASLRKRMSKVCR